MMTCHRWWWIPSSTLMTVTDGDWSQMTTCHRWWWIPSSTLMTVTDGDLSQMTTCHRWWWIPTSTLMTVTDGAAVRVGRGSGQTAVHLRQAVPLSPRRLRLLLLPPPSPAAAPDPETRPLGEDKGQTASRLVADWAHSTVGQLSGRQLSRPTQFWSHWASHWLNCRTALK